MWREDQIKEEEGRQMTGIESETVELALAPVRVHVCYACEPLELQQLRPVRVPCGVGHLCQQASCRQK